MLLVHQHDAILHCQLDIQPLANLLQLSSEFSLGANLAETEVMLKNKASLIKAGSGHTM